MIIRKFIFQVWLVSISLFSFAYASSIDEDSGLPKGQRRVTITQQGEEFKEPTHKDVRVQRVLEDKSTVRTKSVVEKELEIAEKQEKVAKEKFNAGFHKIFTLFAGKVGNIILKKLQLSLKIKFAEWEEKSVALTMLQAEKSLVLAAENENQVFNPQKSRFVVVRTLLRAVGIINPTTEQINAWITDNLDMDSIEKYKPLKKLEAEFQEKKAAWEKHHKAFKELETVFQEKKAAWEKKKEDLEKLMEEKESPLSFQDL